jgi:uncharacterized protein (TIGR02145 family)
MGYNAAKDYYMKHKHNVLWFIICMISLAFVACEKDPNNNNHSNHSGNGNPVLERINNAVTDYDGNHYDAVKIGKQVWMSENLKTTHYADGTEIPVSDPSQVPEHAFLWSVYLSSDVNPYVFNVNSHYFYNRPALMRGASSSNSNPSGIQGVCPDGWHVPSWAEWQELKDYCSGFAQLQCDSCEKCIGKALAVTYGWQKIHDDFYPCDVGYNPGSNNATGFSAQPNGALYSRGYGHYYDDEGDSVATIGPGLVLELKNEMAFFWSTTKNDSGFLFANISGYSSGLNLLSSDDYHVPNVGYLGDYSGLSVRCVRN